MAAAIEYYGTGRRKTSTARVFLRPGTGTLTINRKTFEEAFPTEAHRNQIKQPLAVTETADKFEVGANYALGPGIKILAGAQYYNFAGPSNATAAQSWAVLLGMDLRF